MNGVLQANIAENLLGLAVLVAWVVINFMSARKRQGPRPGAETAEMRNRPPPVRPVRPRPSMRSPEEELQEFLEKLAGGTPAASMPEAMTEAEPAPPATPARPPTYISPVPSHPTFPARPAPSRARDRRPKVRPPPPPPLVPAAPAHEMKPAILADFPPPPQAPRVSVASFRMPGVHMPAMRVVGALPAMAAGALGGDLRRGAPYKLDIRDRDRLRRAVLMQAILAPPPALQ